ncbi:PTS glucose transporter subunit IIA [Sporolactobacillus sp. THM19-2]|uniref:PTS sugar transporter subunit IIA n=1 Tax=Sporolactobacillus sp. THM19-2 TaxID=2511171 RepID=UPI0010207F74|nr:PTS glucose transporter subunit IIA [Sporolactobacillus sp. THM19-2]RYL94099.1 PTS glucose transporter subunit IIA [Sporolactobacillus sp. THM19-2]
MSLWKKLFQTKRQRKKSAVLQEEIAHAGDVLPPLSGKVIPITEVPDPAFAQKMMGDGFAIIPEEDIVRSPVNGVVTSLFPTRHALSLRANDGHELLIHVGLETVTLKGEGFDPLVHDGSRVLTGDPLMHVDFHLIEKRGLSPISPVVFTNLKKEEKVVIDQGRIFIRS